MTNTKQILLSLTILGLIVNTANAKQKSAFEDCGGIYSEEGENGRCKWCDPPYVWYQPPSPPLSPLFKNGFCVLCNNKDTQEIWNGWCFCYKKYAPRMIDWKTIEIDSVGNMVCADIEKECGGLANFPLYELGTGKHQIMICNQTKAIEAGAAAMPQEEKEFFINKTIYQGASQDLVNQVILEWKLIDGVTGSFKLLIPMELKTVLVDLDVFLLTQSMNLISSFNPTRDHEVRNGKNFLSFTQLIPIFKFQNPTYFDCEQISADMKTTVKCKGQVLGYPIDNLNTKYNISISDEPVHKIFRDNNSTLIYTYALENSFLKWDFKLVYSYFISSDTPLNVTVRTFIQELPCSGCNCATNCQLEVNYNLTTKLCKSIANCENPDYPSEVGFLYGEDAYFYIESKPADTKLGVHEVWAIDNLAQGTNITRFVDNVKSDTKGKLIIKIPMALPASEIGNTFGIKIIVKLLFDSSRRLSVRDLFNKRILATESKTPVALSNIAKIQIGPIIPEYTRGTIVNYEIMTWVLFGLLAAALLFLGLFVCSTMIHMKRMDANMKSFINVYMTDNRANEMQNLNVQLNS